MQASGMSRSEAESMKGNGRGRVGRSRTGAIMNMPPGWYPDPSGDPSLMRWWDGEEWTGDFAPAQQVTPDGNRIRRARTR